MRNLRWLGGIAALGAVALLGGCVAAPVAYPTYPAYGAYGESVYVQPAPVLVPAPALSIGIGGYYGGGYYRAPYWRGRSGYWGYGGRGYGGRGRWR